jgi:hypothetical protein
MTDFRPDCIINLHAEFRGKPAKVAWACSIEHAKAGRVVAARRFLGVVPRDEAEISAVLFGLRQASRFLQEKVELRATFSLEGKLGGGTGRPPPRELRPAHDEAARLWEGFRLRRTGRVSPDEALALREEAEKAYLRKSKRES